MVDTNVQMSSLLGHKTCDHIQAYPSNPGRTIRAGLQGYVLCVAYMAELAHARMPRRPNIHSPACTCLCLVNSSAGHGMLAA
jgi:hypothetical protein